MRVAAAILAMVMSVTTGGSLRCPCHVLTLLKGDARCVSDTPNPVSNPDEDECCPCKSHRKKEENKSPHSEKKSPCSPPCPHGSGIDLPPPYSSGERVAGDHDLGVRGDSLGVPPSLQITCRCDAVRDAFQNPFAPPHQSLKYCFAFRC